MGNPLPMPFACVMMSGFIPAHWCAKNLPLRPQPRSEEHTAHSLNPVPFVYVSKEHTDAQLEDGILADVAPSLCHILGVEQPAEMTGHNLIK